MEVAFTLNLHINNKKEKVFHCLIYLCKIRDAGVGVEFNECHLPCQYL